MALFGFGKKKKAASLDEMIAFAEECKRRKLETLGEGEVNDCLVYVDDHWEVQFLIGAPGRLVDVLSQGRTVNTSFALSTFSSRGDPFVVVLFRFDNNHRLSYAGLASPNIAGDPDTPLRSLNYFDVLLAQPEIRYVQKGKTKQFSGKIRNPLQNSPQLKQIKEIVDAALAKGGHDHYMMARVDAAFAVEMEAMADSKPGVTKYERMGQILWDKYEAAL